MSLRYVGKAWSESAWFVVAPSAGSRPAVSGRRGYTDASDPDLVSWSADGDRRAFDEIVTRHGPFALRVAARLIPDPKVAEDVVQEAMLRAWSQAGQFDPQRARLTTWLYRILVNLCIDHRRRWRFEPLPEGFDAVDPAAGIDEVMERSERVRAFAKVVRNLPVRQRAAMTLVYDEGMSGAEAARVLGMSAKAVERLLSRARAYLREHLVPEHDGDHYGKEF